MKLKSFLTKVIITGIMAFASTIEPQANNIPARMLPSVPDTVYTKEINSTVILDGLPMEGANIAYTIYDTVNGNTMLIREAVTNENGIDHIDSLPVIKHTTQVQDIVDENKKSIIITNNGTGSDHLIRFRTTAQQVAPDAHIISMLGQEVSTLKLNYNENTKTYDAIWHGQSVKDGVYLFLASTSQGPVADKLVHKEHIPSIIDYGKSVPSLKDASTTKSSDEISANGASKYIISITHEGLEDFIDTVLLKEQTYHDFFFHPTPIQYDSGFIQGLIFFDDLTGKPNSADVEYKRLLNPSASFSTTATNGFYEITVPIVYEPANPEQTKYLVTISPNGGDNFIPITDTVLVSSGGNMYYHHVHKIIIEPTQDITGVIRNVYSKEPESDVIIRVIDRISGELIEEEVTGTDGSYFFENLPEGAKVKFELGKPGELWMVNNEYDVPEELSDTLIMMNRYFYPKIVQVPQVGTNTTIEGDGEEIAEMAGADIINFEEVLRDADYMWNNGGGTGYWDAREWIKNNFYEGTSPIITANTQRDITQQMVNNYEPYTNYYPGQLGWNVDFGSGNLTIPIHAATNYGVSAVMGGHIETTDDGTLAPYLKELQGRRLQLGDVTSRPSMMNAQATMPTEKDRAYIKLILINQRGRFKTDQETYSLQNLTSIEPSKMTSASPLKEPALTGEHTDIPGNKPHCKKYFDKDKYRTQQQAKRREQIEKFISANGF